MTRTNKTIGHNCAYKKMAVHWLNEALCFDNQLSMMDLEELVGANSYAL